MGEIADMMLGSVLCAMCGQSLDCEDCEDIGIPMYCDKECAKDAGVSKYQICKH